MSPSMKDRYKRQVAKIYIEGKYLNQMIVAEGLAWWYKRYAPKDEDLRKAENDARASKIGLWSHPNPIPPWKFRRHKVSTGRGIATKDWMKPLRMDNRCANCVLGNSLSVLF